MEHLIDIFSISIIVVVASGFLFRTFKKAKSGCGGICSGCNNSCQTTVKQFKATPITIHFKK